MIITFGAHAHSQARSLIRRVSTGPAGRQTAVRASKRIAIGRSAVARTAALGTPVLDAAGQVVERLATRAPHIDHSAVVTIIEEGLA